MTINLARALRGLGICALIGAVTTLLNTVAPNFYSAPDFDGRMALIHHPIYAARQWVLLAHPAFTIVMALGLALGFFARAAAPSASAFIFAGVEKMTEFVLGFLIIAVVNPIWKAGYLGALGTPAATAFRGQIELFNEMLGGIYYLLWVMFILSTALFASALDRRSGFERWLFWSAMGTVAITVVMLVGDVAGLEAWSGPLLKWLYPPLMTAHRTLAGLWLLAVARRLSAERCARG